MTTHSTVISSAVSINNVIHVSRVEKPLAVPLRFCGLSEPSRKFVDRWLDVTKSNLLFAKGVVLVEGIAEAIVVPELARVVLQRFGEGKDSLEDYGVSVINLNGIYFNYLLPTRSMMLRVQLKLVLQTLNLELQSSLLPKT